MQKEFCICAAVRTTCGGIVRGHRHHDCIDAIVRRGLEMEHSPEAQGFITSTGRYVTRAEGRMLQDAAGIPSADEGGFRHDTLYSEDLYAGPLRGSIASEQGHPLTPQEFEAIYRKVTRLCVDIILFGPEGILLTKRALPSWYGQWHIPGGTVRYREDPEAAVRRILKREIGHEYVALHHRAIDHISYPSEMAERGFGWSIALVYIGEIKEQDVDRVIINEESSELGYFKVLPDPMVAEQRELIMRHRETLIALGATVITKPQDLL